LEPKLNVGSANQMEKGMVGRYDGLGLYHDPADSRVFVPKPNPMMGWTINVSHPFGRRVLYASLVAVAAAGIASLLMR
jgi:uncharacterized membrane protein